MTSNVYEAGLRADERAKIVEWLLNAQNLFLKRIKEEDEWGAFRDFFTELACGLQISKITSAKDFVKVYHETAENFEHYSGRQYDEATHGIMHMAITKVLENLLENGAVPEWFSEEAKQREAADRITPLAKNN